MYLKNIPHYIYNEYGIKNADFYNVDLANDNELFLNPYEIELLDNPIAQKATATAIDFFEMVRQLLISGEYGKARQIFCSYLSEPHETCFGYSKEGLIGKGVQSLAAYVLGSIYSDDVLLHAIKRIEDIKLFIKNISNDRVSDIYTNVIRGVLVEYTQQQCAIHGIKMQKGETNMFWDPCDHQWKNKLNTELFVWDGKTKLLVPKAFVKRDSYNTNRFNNLILLPDYINKELEKEESSIVITLKDGTRRVTKKAMREDLNKKNIALDKERALEHLHNNPNCLKEFRDVLEKKRNKKRPNNK